MTPEQQAIIDLLRQFAIGKKNATTADEIYIELVSQGHHLFRGRTQEQVRQIIRDLVNSQTELIGSTSKGYYIISNKNEAQDAIANLRGRSDSMRNREDNIKDLWNRQNPNDLI